MIKAIRAPRAAVMFPLMAIIGTVELKTWGSSAPGCGDRVDPGQLELSRGDLLSQVQPVQGGAWLVVQGSASGSSSDSGTPPPRARGWGDTLVN
jgi:hypothetical protein